MEINNYYHIRKDQVLIQLTEGTCKTFILKPLNSYCQSTYFTFAPFSCVIHGDWTPNANPITSYKYNIENFISDINAKKLAADFLQKEWSESKAAEDIENYLKSEIDAGDYDLAEKESFIEIVDKLKYRLDNFYCREMMLLELYEINPEGDWEEHCFGMEYNKTAVLHLAAIQQLFKEKYTEL